MANKKNRDWIKAHINDPYVKLAQKAGYRSRAAFKLLEIQEKDQLIQAGDCVLDCGAAPGGWSDLIRRWVGPTGKTVAVDLLAMDAVPYVHFIQGDFTASEVLESILDSSEGKPFQVVVSDMAPNLSGHAVVDQLKTIGLLEDMVSALGQLLAPGGHCVMKAFHGEGFDDFLRDLRKQFGKIQIRKPKASRDASREVYLVCKGYKSA